MRIISGKFKSRKFKYKLPNGIRPTTDMVKESLFNILDNLIDYNGLRVLDLFSGSGNIGIEFLSRGAEFVHFNDFNSNSIGYISNILKELNIENYKITKQKADILLKNIEDKFDLIFIDPPYISNQYEILSELISKKKLIENGSVIIFESDEFKKIELNQNLIKERKFGSSVIRIYGNIS